MVAVCFAGLQGTEGLLVRAACSWLLLTVSVFSCSIPGCTHACCQFDSVPPPPPLSLSCTPHTHMLLLALSSGIDVLPQELSEDELVQVLTGPKNALTKQYKQLFSLNKAGFGVTQSALRAIARKAIDKGTGTRSLRSIMEGLLIEVMYHVPEQGPAAAEAGSPIAVLLDEEAVESGVGARIVPAAELERVLAADAAAVAAAADSGSMSDGGASDGGEPIAAEVR